MAMLASLPWLSLGADGEGSQFIFDPNGNLVIQAAGASAPPQILAQPQQRIVNPGESASFSVVVRDTHALSYQWQFKGVDISGATGDAVVLQNVSSGHEGEYRVVLTNPSGSVTSAPAALWIDSDADGQPDAWERLYFSNLNQNATADFDGDGVSNATEFLDNTNPTNRLSARFALTLFTDGNGLVEINPQGSSYTNGQSVTLTATPSGTNLFYGWTGSTPSTNNPLLITIASNTMVRAHFQFLPLDIVWTNKAGGDWHSAANWSPNQVPGASDNAFIPMATAVTNNSLAECLGLTLANGPTLTGGGTLMIYGTLQWTLGTMGGSGRTILNTNGVANIAALANLVSRTFENRGTVLIYNTAVLNVMQGAVMTNCAGALFQVVNETPSLGGGLANGRFDNAGRFVRSSGSGTLTVNSGLGFNNFGTVDIQSGLWLCDGGFTNAGTVNIASSTTLRLAGGGSATGSFAASGGALVEWTRGTFVLNPGTQFEGLGLYRINAGTLLADLDVDLNQLELRSGTLGGNGTLTITNRMDWTGGGMSGIGRTVISAGATLHAALPSGGSLNERVLDNRGTMFWSGSGNIGCVNAVITNQSGGVFHAQGDGGMTFVSGANRFDNAGTFRKSVRSETLGVVDFTRSGSFNNFGTMEIQAGTFLCIASFTNQGVVQLSTATTNRLAGGGSATGTFVTPTDALVEWTGGKFTLNPGAQLSGPGLYRINGNSANVTVNADVSVQNFDLVNGDSALTGLSGTGRLTINNSMNWAGAAMSGAGRTVIAPAATLSLTNSSFISLLRTLENAGTVSWTGPGIIGLLNGAISNRAGAVFEVSSAGRVAFSGGGCRIDNAGTFRKTGGTGTVFIDAGVPFNNSGTVDLRSGILAANGGFFSSGTSLLRLGIGGVAPGEGHAQLRLPGTLQLAGGLEAEFLPGFSPQVNQSFVVVSAGNRTGAFDRFLYPSNSVTLLLSNTPNSVVVLVQEGTLTIPSPELLHPIVLGNNVLLTWTSRSNLTYRLEFVPDLSQPISWIPVPGDVLATGNTASKLEFLTSSNRFYRVRPLP